MHVDRLVCAVHGRAAGRGILIALTIGLAAATVSAAGTPSTLEERAAAIDAVSAQPEGDRVVAGHISRKLQVSVDTLRTERAQTGLGWGALLVAHLLSRETGQAIGEVAAELRNGKAWLAVVLDHGVEPDKFSADVQRSQEAIEQRSEDRVRTDKAAPTRSGSGKGSGRGAHRP